MTRLLAFNYIDNEYLIQENNETIFQINADDLRFDSLKFYQGLYHVIKDTMVPQKSY